MRMSITLLALRRADPGALGKEAHFWGTYCSHLPMVLAGQVPQVLRLMQRAERARMGMRYTDVRGTPFTRPMERFR